MKKRKILIPVFFILLFFVIFGISFFIWKTGWEHSSADTNNTVNVSEPINNSNGKIDLFTVHSTFYNYRYDDEIKYGTRTQGSQSSDNKYETPYVTFNNKLNWYYTHDGSGIDVGLYEGNFYWYWKDEITASTKNFRYNWDWCLNTYANFKWAANIANRYGEETDSATYAAACQGIVDDELSGWNSSNILSGTLTNHDKALPFFNKDFLDWTSDASSDTTKKIGAYAEDVGFPFRSAWSSDKGNYYVFDSTKDVVRFNGMESESGKDARHPEYYFGNTANPKLEYYYNDKQIIFSTTDNAADAKPYFFPYNKQETFYRNKTANDNNLDYGFGVRLDIPFYLSKDGMQTEANGGKPMKFNFSGDDDVWVFLDGKLTLDIGGDHGKATGYIDFSYKGEENVAKAVVNEVSYLKDTNNPTSKSHCFETNNTRVGKQEKEIDLTQKEGKHTLTIFYMERGMIESNLYMDFSFVPIPADDAGNASPIQPITPPDISAPSEVKQSNSELTIKNTVVYDNINSQFVEKVKNIVENDGFQYKVQNQGTLAGDIGDSGLAYPSGVLSVRKNREVKSYWSFGERPYARVYFDMTRAKSVEGNNFWDSSKVYTQIENPNKNYALEHYEMIKADYISGRNVFYYDVPLGWKFCFQHSIATSLNKFPYFPNFASLTASEKLNGAVFLVDKVINNGGEGGGDWERSGGKIVSKYDKSDKLKYSDNLPYQTKTTPAPTFVPADSSVYSPVADTAYELTEHFPAPIASDDPNETNILLNSATTTRLTDTSGIVSLLSENSATFYNQFRKGSNMKVVLEENLATISRPNPIGHETGNTYISTFSEGTRGSNEYYYSTSNAKEGDNAEKVTINRNGTFAFNNVNDTDAANDAKTVNITETFTHTVKTGSITLYKKLKGSVKADASYEFTVKFKNIFGVTSEDNKTGNDTQGYGIYPFEYTLYTKENGTYKKSQKTVTDGKISLKADEYAVIDGIPVGTKYKILENATANNATQIVSSVNVSYHATVSGSAVVSGKSGNEVQFEKDKDGAKVCITGIIPTQVTSSNDDIVNGFDEVDVKIVVTNQAGILKIRKKVTGEWTDYKDASYTFIIKAQPDNTSLKGKDYTIYEDNSGGNYGSVDGIVIESGIFGDETTHQIKLKAGQWVEIYDLPLNSSNGYQYTITEEKGYYDLSSLTVKNGTATVNKDGVNPTSVTTAELNSTNPQVDVEFVNRYDNYYIEIEKYVDKLYYTDDEYFYKNASDQVTYQELSNAEQSFIFKVEEYDDSTCSGTASKVFDVTISVTGAAVLPNPVTPNGSSDEYNYKASKRIQATPGKYYKITEDTGWSWKYSLETVLASDNGTRLAKDNAIAKVESKSVILNGYRKGTDSSKPSVPTASFYNKRKNTDVEGDTSFITNIIKKKN